MPYLPRFVTLWTLAAAIWVGGASDALSRSAIADDGLDFFESKIRPILVERCYECHSSRAKSVKGGLRLDRRAALLAGGESGPSLVPGQPDKSLLLQAVRYSPDVSPMPPSGKMPESEVALLTEWIRRGAPFPADSADAADAAVAKKPAIDFEAGRRHWAFLPLADSPLPVVRGDDWPAGRVDRFLLSRLEQQRQAPAPDAAARELVRRVTFDLLGLPPTFDELEQWTEELTTAESPPAADAAYARLVDRLLASPRFGERWGRMWLDLVRYCDTPESWVVDKSAQAWLYRDWVVAAWNQDLPYDRFVERQLAVDLTPDHSPDELAALGMLGLSPSYWKELKLDPAAIKTVVAEEWEERLQTLGGTFLGLTIGCARCHDHKFDPISSEDYYGLAGVLASSRQTARAVVPATQATQVRAAQARVQQLEKDRQALLAKKPTDDAQKQEQKQKADQLAAEIVELRATPRFDSSFAYAVDEASLHVLPNGAHSTKLDYRQNAPLDLAMQIRGNPTNVGPVVPRRFLEVLSSSPPRPFQHGSGRLELARSITGDAAPLVARVMVNRLWKQLFGQGLVDTPSNFGVQGSRPTHPELLDDLARRFVANGWSAKSLVRELATSRAYRLSSRTSDSDPDNRLWGRASRKRLDVESWRDAMLSVTGQLDLRIGGEPTAVDQPTNRRRTVYALIRRRELHDILRLYDFPDPMTHSAGRDKTTTPLQQLFVMNSPFFAQQAKLLADRVRREAPRSGERGYAKDDGRRDDDLNAQIDYAYRLLFGRRPSERQRRAALEFFAVASPAAASPVATATSVEPLPTLDSLWTQYAQALLASNEFFFLD